MKCALVCIAKNESNYIDEWIAYHLKLGFDSIYVYQNNWRHKYVSKGWSNVNWIEYDGESRQNYAYNDFIVRYSGEYDWCAFFDVDEFLVIKDGRPLYKWLEDYESYSAIGVNWRLFGDNGLTAAEGNDYSIVNRFTKCEKTLNRHVKTILHTSMVGQAAQFINPHFVQLAYFTDFTINTKRTKYVRGAFNDDFDDNVQLNHYYCKTYDEYRKIKRSRGMADQDSDPNEHYTDEAFNAHNKNEIDDFYARDFMNSYGFVKPLSDEELNKLGITILR